MLSPFLVSPLKIPYPPPSAPQPTHSHLLSWQSPILRHRAFTGPRTSPPTDVRLGHSLLHMQLESGVPPCLLFGWWFSPWEFWGYWLVHIVVPPMGLQTPSAPWVLSLAPLLGPMVDCKHPLLYLSGTGRTSQETAISGSCQKALVGTHNSVQVW